MNKDAHAIITQNIIDIIEAGNTTHGLPWRQLNLFPVKLSDGSPYRGVNVLNLCAVAMLRGYSSPVWGGFNAWRAAGGTVRRGEKASIVVFSTVAEVENKRTGEKEAVVRGGSRSVFNRDQIDGLEDESLPSVNPMIDSMVASDIMEKLAKDNGATVRVQGQEACYLPSSDVIVMPFREHFLGTATQTADMGYASTLGHELVHYTGHSSRLNRQLGGGKESADYAKEELIAELGSAFLCAELGFKYTGVEDHAGYLEFWLTELKADKKALFNASVAATAAVEWLTKRAPGLNQCSPEPAQAMA